MLAKEGSRLDSADSISRILDRLPEGLSVSLHWENEIVEMLTRKFLKKVLDLKTSTE